MKHPISDFDPNYISRLKYDAEHQADRVVIAGVGNLAESVKTGMQEGLKNMNLSFPDIKFPEIINVPQIIQEKSIETVQVPQILIQKEIETIRVPEIIKEIEFKEIEKTVIIPQLEIREIQIPQIVKEYETIQVPQIIIQKEIIEIEKPVIVKEVEIKTIEIEKPVYIKEMVPVDKIIVHTEFKEVEKPVYIKEIEVIKHDVPVIQREVQIVEIPRSDDKYIKAFIIIQSLATMALLALNYLKH